MQHDQIRLILRLFQELGDRTKNKGIANSMEPIFPQTVRLGHFLVDGVCFHILG